jgi:hypothetical protein
LTAEGASDRQAYLRVVKAHAKEELGGLEGVQGIGIGDRVLRVYVRNAAVRRHLPDTFEGVPVECVEVGDVEAQPG